MRQIYKDGLKSWVKIKDLLEKAEQQGCLVCNENDCLQWEELGLEPSEKAEDCPIVDKPNLCREMCSLAYELSVIHSRAINLVGQLKEAHREKKRRNK